MNKQSKKGFTLVELLVVIAILAILGTVSIVGYTSFTTKAKNSVAEQEMTQVKTLLLADWLDGEVEYTNVNEYSLLTSSTAPENWSTEAVYTTYYTHSNGEYVKNASNDSNKDYAANKFYSAAAKDGKKTVTKQDNKYKFQLGTTWEQLSDVLYHNEVKVLDGTNHLIDYIGSADSEYISISKIQYKASNGVYAIWNIADDSVSALKNAETSGIYFKKA